MAIQAQQQGAFVPAGVEARHRGVTLLAYQRLIDAPFGAVFDLANGRLSKR